LAMNFRPTKNLYNQDYAASHSLRMTGTRDYINFPPVKIPNVSHSIG
jgi:hypothetical protein